MSITQKTIIKLCTPWKWKKEQMKPSNYSLYDVNLNMLQSNDINNLLICFLLAITIIYFKSFIIIIIIIVWNYKG